MLNTNKHKGIEDLEKLSLSVAEREQIFTNIIDYTNQHPIPPIPSGKPSENWYNKLIIGFSNYRYVYSTIGITMCFLMIGGGAVMAAAEKALPGDKLYAVKINLNEPLQGVFKVKAEIKRKWQEHKAMKRLQEAEILAKQGNFDDIKRAVIEKEFSKNVDAFIKINLAIEAEIEKKNKDYKDKIESYKKETKQARLDFEVRLADQLDKIKSKKKSLELAANMQNMQIDNLEVKVREKIKVVKADNHGNGNGNDNKTDGGQSVNGSNKNIEAQGQIELKVEKVEVKTPIKTDWLKEKR